MKESKINIIRFGEQKTQSYNPYNFKKSDSIVDCTIEESIQSIQKAIEASKGRSTWRALPQ